MEENKINMNIISTGIECVVTPVPDYFIHEKIDSLNLHLDKLETHICILKEMRKEVLKKLVND
jgi:hypothetical protein